MLCVSGDSSYRVLMSFFSVMNCVVSEYDPLSVSVSFSAESTTLLSADIRLRPKAVRHFPPTYGQPLTAAVHISNIQLNLPISRDASHRAYLAKPRSLQHLSHCHLCCFS